MREVDHRGLIALLVSAQALVLLATACSAGPNAKGSGGTITVSGSSTVEPITSLVAEKYVAQNPGVQPSVDGPGTGDGFELFCNGEVDIADASRPIEPEEEDHCKENHIDFVELEVALDGLSVIGNPANPVECLAFGDLYALFGPESASFSNWTDADELAASLGGYDEFPDETLTIAAPGEESGTYGSFIDLAIGDIASERDQPDDQLRTGYQSSGDDNVIVENAAGTVGGLGFVGFSFAESAGDEVKEFEIDGGAGCVAPTPETVIDGSYPLARSLYLYVSEPALLEKPAVAAFVDYYLSDDGLASVEEVDFVSVPQERIDATRAAWAAARQGLADG